MTNEEKKQRIEDFRKIIKPFIAKKLQKINYEGMGVIDKTEFESDFEVILTLAESALAQQPREDATLQDIFCMGCEYKEQQSCPYWDYGLNTCRHANIGALATVEIPKWIPVSERLPEDDTRVLITTTSALGTERIVLEVSYLNGVFIRGFSSYTPSAWMPLPAPYEEEEPCK